MESFYTTLRHFILSLAFCQYANTTLFLRVPFVLLAKNIDKTQKMC
jgi:hypothetical protein